VLQLAGTLSEQACYEDRPRRCDLGYLRQAYRMQDGTLGWRCPAEPVEDFVAKGGAAEETQGRKCLCNALLSNIGLGQLLPDGSAEKPLITSGDDVAQVARFLRPGALSYRAIDVIQQILPDVRVPGHPTGSVRTVPDGEELGLVPSQICEELDSPASCEVPVPV
jgi:hypothetical protein